MNEDFKIFDCKQCGDCCSGYGGTYVTEQDLAAIAAFCNIPLQELKSRYCDISNGKPVLRQGPDGKCIFFKENCSIHPVKPRMCREWPFIPGVLRNPGNWKLMATACPGIDPDAPEDTVLTEIRNYLDQTRGKGWDTEG